MRVRCGAEKKNGGGTGGPRAESGAEDAACRDDRAEQIRFEKFGDEIGDGHGAPAKKIEDALFAEAANAAAGFEKIPEIFRDGESMAGGVMEMSSPRMVKRWSSVSANCVYFAASLGERRAMPAAVLAALS